MIATDKYEGHTEGPWVWERGALNVLHVKDSEPMHTLLHDEKKDADAQLIADAPLLLEEVKRLRERLIRAYDWAENAVNGNDSAMMDYTEYVCGGD